MADFKTNVPVPSTKANWNAFPKFQLEQLSGNVIGRYAPLASATELVSKGLLIRFIIVTVRASSYDKGICLVTFIKLC